MNAVMEKAKGLFRRKEESRQEQRRSLVNDIIDEKDVDPAKVAAVFTSESEFDAEVAAVKNERETETRRLLRQSKVDRIPELRESLRLNAAEQEEQKRLMEEHAKAMKAELGSLMRAGDELRAELQDARAAEDELRRGKV